MLEVFYITLDFSMCCTLPECVALSIVQQVCNKSATLYLLVSYTFTRVQQCATVFVKLCNTLFFCGAFFLF